MLVMFPLGLFTLAVLFDLGNLLGGPALLGALGYWNIVAGLVGGLLAAIAVAIDVMFVAGNTRAKRIGVIQGLVNMGVLTLFAVILILRMQHQDRSAGGGILAIELLSLSVAVFSSWYGGELVRRPGAVFARAQAGNRSY
ncbi:DUF2231 domain-containing protein [Mangrovihabitans endophyticus]|uniref:DUF2231 domain-containing protein n=1 Tax=Mangrovihabitans endophyticus TaxID=1751298 RepID=A0A8J3C2P6_9ACTN|nr:DUF2231 domain-containing protein [Mangrovihabitans endophyticus]GGK98695.1 hypothetical protein GCM10012284_36210 [Mangrovihabitans endophyticus]